MTDMTELPAPDCEEINTDFSDLKAVFINCSLKKDSAQSHTATLMKAAANIMRKHNIGVEWIHAADHQIAYGIYPDMTEHGFEKDAWVDLWPKVRDADILVLGTPIWLGEESSVCRIIIERLYAMSGELNEKNQSIFYNKVGGAVITGNEDGVKHTSMSLLYALQHIGYTVPPQADCGWIGEVGPGASYGDELEDGSHAGFGNEFTQRNTTIMTWNLIHLARMLKDSDGIPTYGNDRKAWADGCRFDYENPGTQK
jgi:multimeric flavodoxin WrbA